MTSSYLGKLPNLSAVAWELWHRLHAPRSQWVLVPDLEWAESLRSDILSWDPSIKISILPALETDLLRNRGPSLATRSERLRALNFQIEFPKVRHLVFVPAAALAQKTPNFDFFAKHSLRLQVGAPLERDALQANLAMKGYLPSELVENPGQYALRGTVLDIFPSTHENPVRVEIFEDEITSLRSFHPESQRKLGELQELMVGPAREFSFPESSASTSVFQALKSEVRGQKRSLGDREALLVRFQQQSLFQEIDYWGPFLAEIQAQPLGGLLDFLPRIDAIVEAHVLEGILVASSKEMERELASALEEGEWVPDAPRFLLPLDEQLEKLRRAIAKSALWLSYKKTSGLTYQPENSVDSAMSGHDLLDSELSDARKDHSQAPLQPLLKEIGASTRQGHSVTLVTRSEAQLERLGFLLGQYGVSMKSAPPSWTGEAPTEATIFGVIGAQINGFRDPERRWNFIVGDTIFGTKKKRAVSKSARKSTRSILSGDFALFDLQLGDHVVHTEHGVGRYLGLKIMDFDGIPTELVEIEYKDGNKLFVPVTRLSLIQKHSAANEAATLDRMGGQTWENKRAKVKKELQSIAGELLHLYSIRAMARGPEIIPPKEKIDEFAASFPYTETEDQMKAITDCLNNIQGPQPMDRLVCGDVGYGKTEVALRVAHAVAAAGYQVAVLVPTTLLAVQHEATFKRRLGPFGFEVGGLSRFKTGKERTEILADVQSGKIRVVIGTHSLLSNDIKFPKLGLLVIDEEQKFGVVHKEKIKRLKNNVHVLSMSATPIPRTLNMAMSGLKELSLISTPPLERVSIKTFIARKNTALIRDAVEKEIARGGQIFYVHNRVQTIVQEYDFLKELLPTVKIEYAHGQMEESDLEKRVLGFYEGRIQLLLTTSIIESGLDIPTANTLIIDRADTFGLSQLYQLRGRVGRSSERGFAYFMIPEKGKVSGEAEERLSILEAYQHLGSGFHIASHDLEMRGAGDLLGRSQSGSISALGFDSYAQLLEECIAELKGEHLERHLDPDIQIPIDSSIPEYYIPEIGLRLMAYRRLAASITEDEIEEIAAEMLDRFGSPPESVQNLYLLMRIKCQLRRLGIRAAVASRSGVSLTFDDQTPVDPQKMIESIKRYPAHYQLTPDGKLLIKRPVTATQTLDVVRGVEGALAQLESWCS
ncbi:MAG: transcription-repair coupling factor [Bdellovibrionota bacterium]